MNTIRKKIIVGLMSLLIILPQVSLADGMMMPPQGYWIQETGQKAVIMYEDGIETMVISTSFEGDANDFAWVIPVPNKPEVSKGSQALFTNLNQLTGYTVSNSKSISLGLGAAQDVAYEGVTIVEEKQIDYYDVTVLSSTDKDSLVTWLNDNEYNFPTSASYILNSYVDNDWYFVAMKVNPESLEWIDVSKKLRKGEATPVVLTFEAKNIVYPMKISSIISEAVEEGEEDVVDIVPPAVKTPTYVTGKVGSGVSLGVADYFTADALNVFRPDVGTIEMWVSPSSSWESAGGGYWELINVVDSNGKDVFEFRRGKDSNKDVLQFIAYQSDGSFKEWSTTNSINWDNNHWYHLAVTWSDAVRPEIYIDGVSQSMSSTTGSNQWTIKNFSAGDIYIGTRGSKSASLKATIDELKISRVRKTFTEISTAYYLGINGIEVTSDINTTLLAHFDNTLDNVSSTKDLAYKGVSASTTKTTTKKISNPYPTYNNVPVVLYVLANNKKALPGFSTTYANWIDKESIEKLAIDDQGDPLLNPTAKKYFLTKLSDTLTYDQMTEDLFIRDAENNETSGKEITATGTNSVNTFYLAIGVGLLLSFIFAVAIFIISRKVD